MGKRGRPKGSPRVGGRQKGTPNKSSLTILEKLAAFDNGAGFDPVTEALNLYTLIHADNPLVAVKIPLTLMEYIYPKRKAIEHSGEINNPYLNKSVEELEALVKEKLKRGDA